MNLNIVWNKDIYLEFINYLNTLQDIKYRDFHKKIIMYEEVIGIKTLILKKIAKEISLGDYKGYFKYNNSTYYEPIMIEGLIIGYLKDDFNDIISYINNYLNKVTNWAHIDLLVSNLKILKKYDKEAFIYVKKLIHNKNNYFKRCGVVILLNYYLNDKYIEKVLDIVTKIKSDDYYVRMGISWLLSLAYIKYKEKTLLYIINIKDDFIYNKTLSKIIDSKKISKEEKEFIISLKRQNKKNG